MVSKKVREYREAWDKENTVRVGVKFNRHTDAELIAKVQSEPSAAGYIKKLIRKDIKKGED